MNVFKAIPGPVKARLRALYRQIRKGQSSETKCAAELKFWKSRLRIDGGTFANSHFRQRMLAMAQEVDESFIDGKIVADFGCGPRGSLVWATSARLRVGIDVLADEYADNFRENVISHGMVYVKSTEHVIPVPSDFVDVLFTLNAMDHVDDLARMCKEILRIIKPGGELIASFNLGEPATVCEPQTLTEGNVNDNLLRFLQVTSYRVANQGPEGDQYAPFYKNDLRYDPTKPGYLWVRAKKMLRRSAASNIAG